MSMSLTLQSTEQGQTYQNFIAGEWRNSKSGTTFSSTNPTNTNEIVGYYQKSTVADLGEAVAAARQA
jgi:acyl-CoA reductase-like NAD-dependent aldehyde dehydrogenase